MSYGGFLFRHPLFWAFIVGLALGAALAAATSRPSRARRPRRAASRKWTLTWLCLSVAVAAAAAGLIVPPSLRVLATPSLPPLVVGMLITGLGLRFPRSAGLPVLLLVGTAAVLGGWMVRGYLPIRTETELAAFSVLSVRDDGLSVEVVMKTPDAVGVPRIEVLEGDRLFAIMDQLDVPEAFFLLGALRFVRYAGPPRSPLGPATSPVLDLAVDRGLAQLERVTAEAAAVNLLRTYRLLVSPTAPPRFVQR